jgi:hypothetical protein
MTKGHSKTVKHVKMVHSKNACEETIDMLYCSPVQAVCYTSHLVVNKDRPQCGRYVVAENYTEYIPPSCRQRENSQTITKSNDSSERLSGSLQRRHCCVEGGLKGP